MQSRKDTMIPDPRRLPVSPYLLAASGSLVTALLTLSLRPVLDIANIVMLFLLSVFLSARLLGRGPSVLSAFFSVALFDFFFVPPQLSLTVNDAQYLVTFAVMLAVGLTTAHLTAGMQEHADLAERKERETRELYEVARELAGALTTAQVAEISRRFLDRVHRMRSTLFLVSAEGDLKTALQPDHAHGEMETGFVRSVIDRGELLELDAMAGSSVSALYFPLRTSLQVRGVLAVSPRDNDVDALHARRPMLGTLTSLMAIAVERLHYADVAQETQLQVASERMRNSILSALSHDLRTPLTALVGMAESLAMAKPPLPDEQRETAIALGDQARAMGKLLVNLLDMARLQSHRVTLRKEWQPLEEVLGSSLRLLGAALSSHPLKIDLPADLPLLEFDAVLLERVLCNLLENAAKYSPLDSPIEVSARVMETTMEVCICDRGVAFPPGKEAEVFGLFARGTAESATPGVGLGLAIAKAIVDAHGGSIHAEQRDGGGACVRFSLPLGQPPAIEEEGA
jgi:two-component system sensor histidine kinase KdpD